MHRGFCGRPTRGKRTFDFRKTLKNDAFFKNESKKKIKNLGRAWTHRVNVIFLGLFTRPNFLKKFKQRENRKEKREEEKKREFSLKLWSEKR